MNFLQSILINLIILILIFIFLKKNLILVDNTSISLHKKIGKKNETPIVMGGIYLLLITLFYFKNLTFDIYIIFTSIFLVGLMSDCHIISNNIIRFLSQMFLVFLLTYFGNLFIKDVRVDFLNIFLNVELINFLFVVLCFLVLINGTNFIDGLNGLVSGYYALIFLSLIFTNNNYDLIFKTNIDIQFLNILLFSLIFFFVFNIYGKVYMGDSGSYLIALIAGFYAIKIYEINHLMSPYYFVLLFWYPAFENLFSLIRRLKAHSEITKPDNKHLHQLVFKYFKIKGYFSEKKCNSLTSIMIIIFNIPTFFFASLFSSKTNILIFFLVLNIIFYSLIYLKIIYFFKKKKF